MQAVFISSGFNPKGTIKLSPSNPGFFTALPTMGYSLPNNKTCLP
jgi:hypothetical protein